MNGNYLQSSSTPPWCGAQLEHRDKFTLRYFTVTPINCTVALLAYHFLELCPVVTFMVVSPVFVFVHFKRQNEYINTEKAN